MKTSRYHILTVFTLLSSLYVQGQNNSSPYSVLGIGDIEESFFNRTSGMANTGQAYRSKYYLIQNNPASYSELQDQFFLVEASGRGKITAYSGNTLAAGSDRQSRDFSVNRFSMGIKAAKWWGSSVGIMPFSTSNYAFSGKKSIQGTHIFTYADYEGTGGVNKVYWDNGFKIGKHFSVGVGASYLFGSLNQKETLEGTELTESVITTNNIFLRNFHFTYGAQFFSKLTSKWDIALGGTWSNKTDLYAQHSSEVSSSTTTIKYDITKNDFFTLPQTVGAGLALTKNKKLMMAADYRYQNWSAIRYRGVGHSLTNSNRFSAGVEFSHWQQAWPMMIEKKFYQAGVFYGNSYLTVNNEQLKDMGVTLGVGFSSKRSTLSYLIGLELGMRGTRAKNLIKEQYGKITFTLSYKDFWYTKGIRYN
ncbi:MAG: hypothetical protein KIT80_22825 [Chitinophagaceae bacterium]|nr:hypothetical protein [Chitinophagaceae bacterium]MCW5929772.1 hypothetical protein [Chitinophagaceae bacterium]